jgi:hypothetical protein
MVPEGFRGYGCFKPVVADLAPALDTEKSVHSSFLGSLDGHFGRVVNTADLV